MSIEQEIAALQADVAARTKDTGAGRARAGPGPGPRAQRLAGLKAEFGVETIEEAQAKAGRYEAALKAAAEKARQHLAQAGGEG